MLKVNELLEATKGKLIQGKQDITVRGISIDSRTIKPQEAFIAIKGTNFDGHDFISQAIEKRAACIIVASSRKKRFLKYRKVTFVGVKDTTKALGDIARFQRHKFNIPLIAITGSNGKTTVKEMIAWILSKRLKVLKNEGTKNNQIGLSLTLLRLSRYYDIAVLELGTNHFGETDYLTKICQPNIGIITNIGPAHLEYFHNLEGVFREKYSLIENLKKPYIGILNADDRLLRKQVLKKIKRPFILEFGIRNKSDFFASGIEYFKERIEFLVNPIRKSHTAKTDFSNGVNPIRKSHTAKTDFSNGVNLKYKFALKTLGYYNIYNALAAIAVARIFGLGYKDIASRLAVFDFPQSRLKLIKLKNIRFIDDTYNSNPVSLRQALAALNNLKIKGKKIFIMGDMLELGDGEKSFHCQAGHQAAKVCDILITVGELSKWAAQAARNSGFNIKNIFVCESTQEASDILFNKITPKKEDIVLVKGSRLMKMEEVFKV